MALNKTDNSKVCVSLEDLLKMERVSKNFSLRSSHAKVKSILGGKHASKLRGRGMDFEEVRNYVPGDDIRNIDWKVTARTKKTHSKVFSEEKEKPVFILVDQSKSMFFGSTNYTKSVIAAQLASTIAFRVLKEGDRVGGLIMGDTDFDILSPKRDRKNLMRFLEKLSDKNQALVNSKKLDFEQIFKSVIAKVRNIVTHDYLIFVISDFYRYSPTVLKSIKELSLHNDVVLMKIDDPLEANIPDEKIVIGQDDLQLVMDGTKNKLRKDINENYKDNLSSYESQLKKFGIPLLKFSTTDDLEIQIKEKNRK
ncbi:MAG: DUF58 domain-containing protein [Flavobacteriaceae bacterium]